MVFLKSDVKIDGYNKIQFPSRQSHQSRTPHPEMVCHDYLLCQSMSLTSLHPSILKVSLNAGQKVLRG